MRSVDRLILISVLCAFGLAACGAGSRTLDEDSPEAQAYIYRHSLMEVLDHETRLLRGIAGGDVPADDQEFSIAASNLATLSKMVSEAFMAKGIPPVSRAIPEIWQNADDFKTKDQALQSAAEALAESAQNGGVGASKGTLQQVGQACGSCHRAYRRKLKEE